MNVYSTSKRALLRTQRQWAIRHGLNTDARGYLARVDDNLRQARSARTLAAFEDSGDAQLHDRPGAPATMQALHSSAALVVSHALGLAAHSPDKAPARRSPVTAGDRR